MNRITISRQSVERKSICNCSMQEIAQHKMSLENPAEGVIIRGTTYA